MKTNYPYTYLGIHKETKQFYFGYRAVNKINASNDLGIEYFTSSKNIKNLGFTNFNWYIIAEFFTETAKEDAYELEQQLILDNWKNPLILNKKHQKTGKFAIRTGLKATDAHKKLISTSFSRKSKEEQNEIRKKLSNAWNTKTDDEKQKIINKRKETLSKMSEEEKNIIKQKHLKNVLRGEYNPSKRPEVRENMSKAAKGKKKSKEHAENIKKALIGLKRSDQEAERLRTMNIGRITSEETKQKLRVKKDICKCPHCGKEGGVNTMQRWHFDNCKLINKD